jgi:hypothetical protein
LDDLAHRSHSPAILHKIAELENMITAVLALIEERQGRQ